MPDALPAVAYAIDGDDVAADLASKKARLEETEIELQQTADEGTGLFRQIDALVRAFADKHGCEASSVLDEIDDAVKYLVDDATGPAWRRKCRLENEIVDLEDAS